MSDSAGAAKAAAAAAIPPSLAAYYAHERGVSPLCGAGEADTDEGGNRPWARPTTSRPRP